jgi:hypothetical protein
MADGSKRRFPLLHLAPNRALLRSSLGAKNFTRHTLLPRARSCEGGREMSRLNIPLTLNRDALPISASVNDILIKYTSALAEIQRLLAEVERRNDIINRASVEFFRDGTDGETAAKMLKVLNEAKP